MDLADASAAQAPLATILPLTIGPDPSRTVIRPFLPSDPDAFVVAGHPRAERIVARILALDEAAFDEQLAKTFDSLDVRHRDVKEILLRRFADVLQYVPEPEKLDERRRFLIGAYLSAEYSFEAAALFNPSIVPFGKAEKAGDTRFLISLRGIGEGHMSSVAFRTGTWAADGTVTLDTASATAVPPIVTQPEGWHDGDTIALDCRGSREPSETVLFPVVECQSRGIEDLRLVLYSPPDQPRTYVGSYTAVGPEGIRQELLQTDDFRRFKMQPVHGDLAVAKGLALFPRQIGGRYFAIGRQDNENLWLCSSNSAFTWNGGTKLLEPVAPWEIVQIGNCGSPIEIEEGWLLLTHGVGVVRNYCMGAVLLDRDDPAKVLRRLAEPLLEPQNDDRDGYVPNVVYSCGGLVRDRTLLLPYGVADQFTRFATVSLDRLIERMTPTP